MSNKEIKFSYRFNAKQPRQTRSWKHNRKDRKNYIYNGKVVVNDDFYGEPFTRLMLIQNTNGYMKRNSEFMREEVSLWDGISET